MVLVSPPSADPGDLHSEHGQAQVAGKALRPHSHSATPPWREQVPFLCWLELYEPSTHLAEAPAGGVAAWVGVSTQLPLELT
jgi:hypothetical protein